MDFSHCAVRVFEGQIDFRSTVGLELDRPVDLASSQKQSDECRKRRKKTRKASRPNNHIESPPLPERNRRSESTGKPMQANRANTSLTPRATFAEGLSENRVLPSQTKQRQPGVSSEGTRTGASATGGQTGPSGSQPGRRRREACPTRPRPPCSIVRETAAPAARGFR